MKDKSPALTFVLHAWNSIPRSSWQRLNRGMFAALSNAIASGMKFAPGDLRAMPGIGRWLTGGGEGLYASACGGERGEYNLSAAISFENYFGRTAWLWPEETKSPTRLHHGSRFTWKGHVVTVTSFNDGASSLTACAYVSNPDAGWNEGPPKPGEVNYLIGAYRTVHAYKEYADGSIACRLSAKIENHQDSKVARRFTITHEEFTKIRKDADAKVRARIKKINACDSLDALAALIKSIADEGRNAFRHFDIEDIRAAYSTRKEALEKNMSRADIEKREQADLDHWRAGERVDRLFNYVALRVKNGLVETSTGQHVTLDGARRAYKFVRKCRERGSSGATFNLDQFEIKSVTRDGVTVGCTFIGWTEIDRLAPQLTTKP